MFRIDNVDAVPTLPIIPPTGTPGFFQSGNPSLSQKATIVDAWWANMMQEEILTVVTAGGITPNKVDNTQLLQALQFLFIGPDALDAYLPLAGGTMTGFPLILARDPVLPMEAATRQFVLAQIAGEAPTGFLPLTGGTLYNGGVGALLTLQADTAHDNYLSFVGPRNWLIGPQQAGADPGHFIIYDSTAPRICMTITTTGLVYVTEFAVTDRASLYEVDFGVYGGTRTGWFDGSSGTMSMNGNLTVGGTLQINGAATINGYTTVGDFQSRANVFTPNGYIHSGQYILADSWLQCGADFYCNGPLWARSNLTVTGRAALPEVDFGQSQSSRTGFFDGNNGTLGCSSISSLNTAGTGINLSGGLVVWAASGQLDAFWIHGGCELLWGDLRCLNNDHNANGGGTGWFYTVNCLNAAQSGGIAIYGADGNGIRPADNRYASGISGQAWSQVATYWLNTVSDARLKQDIDLPPEGALAAVAALSPVQYRWRKSEPGDDPLQREISEPGPRLHRGFLAQDVRDVLGEEFGGWSEENGVQGLDYNELTAVLWQAVQELTARVAVLEGPRG